MNTETASVSQGLMEKLFPTAPDFLGMIGQQCDLLVTAAREFVNFMESGDPAKGLLVRELEHRADEIKLRNLDTLNRHFTTPMDREDIYRAIHAVDKVLNYLKTSVREMELFGLGPDRHALAIARLLLEGSEALQRGFAKLGVNPLAAEEDALAARKAERNIEKAYRAALAELFNPEELMAALRAEEPDAMIRATEYTMEMMKRRELYRHLSNTGDQLANAGGVLHDVIVQIS